MLETGGSQQEKKKTLMINIHILFACMAVFLFVKKYLNNKSILSHYFCDAIKSDNAPDGLTTLYFPTLRCVVQIYLFSIKLL